MLIEGKWYNNQYNILKQIGAGGTALIYLGQNKKTNKYYAIKMSQNLTSITNEYNIIKNLQKNDFVPKLFEIDDCIISLKEYYYIAMEYVQGKNLKQLIKGKIEPLEAISIISLLTKYIIALKEEGYYYCDLKPENIIFDKKNKRLILVDFGGVVKKDDTVIEFTPVFDRASWGVGKRIADEKYLIFSLTMLYYVLIKRKRIKPGKENFKLIKNSKETDDVYYDYYFLYKGLTGEIKNLKYFEDELERTKRHLKIKDKIKNENTIKAYHKRIDKILNRYLFCSLLILSIILIAIFYKNFFLKEGYFLFL